MYHQELMLDNLYLKISMETRGTVTLNLWEQWEINCSAISEEQKMLG